MPNVFHSIYPGVSQGSPIVTHRLQNKWQKKIPHKRVGLDDFQDIKRLSVDGERGTVNVITHVGVISHTDQR